MFVSDDDEIMKVAVQATLNDDDDEDDFINFPTRVDIVKERIIRRMRLIGGIRWIASQISKFKCVENLQEIPEVSDVDMTQLNNRRRCFVLQKKELDRIDDKETKEA